MFVSKILFAEDIQKNINYWSFKVITGTGGKNKANF